MADLKAVNAVPLAMTAVGSSTVGDQAGNALADILAWLTKLGCGCDIPVAVTSGYHTLCVLLIVAGAMWLHISIAKPQGENQ